MHQATSSSPRSSISSDSGFNSGRDSPLHGFDSTAALILVPEPELTPGSTHFDFSSDDEPEEYDAHLERLRDSAVPPLPSFSVFLYLFSPYIKLGALLLPCSGLPLKVLLPALLFFAALSALARHLWYMLARYVRRADMEEIMLETFARGRGKEGRRLLIRQAVRLGTVTLRVAVAALYLRGSADAVYPIIPSSVASSISRPAVACLLAVAISPVYFARSLASRSVVWISWLSNVAYLVWFACVAYMHAKGSLTLVDGGSPQSFGVLWEGLPIVAFTFTTSLTIPLYASVKGSVRPSNHKTRRSHSFRLLSVLSIGAAVAALLPLAFFQAPAAPDAPSGHLKAITALSGGATLLLSIPSILITSPALPIPVSIRRATTFPVSKTLIYVLTVGLAILPAALSRVGSDIVLVLAFLSTYFLPAFVHITIHNFRRPLSIVVPPSTPSPQSASASASRTLEPSSSHNDELLLQKERMLQRKRLGRRIAWDIGVWVLLLPVSGGGIAWAVGRIAGRW